MTSKNPVHPGSFVRTQLLAPRKLTVSAAARLIGVGRPALSNFLNGRAAASSQMASRIEVAFGVPAQQILDMQAAFDGAQTAVEGPAANAVPYVPPFLSFKATDIEQWVERNISSRTRFPVLLRTLINSHNATLTKSDFPGNDDGERPGWDGMVEATRPTAWVPAGPSGWEFGTDKDIKRKADGDFAKAVRLAAEEREQTTFVFVTPRHWNGKTSWAKQKKAENLWKDVRAYDSSDLEQWLEQSLAGQVWFANELDRDSEGVRSLENCWTEWAGVANPPLPGSFFSPTTDSAQKLILPRLTGQPNETTVVAADSIEEGLAFLAQLFGPLGGEELEKYRDRVLVFSKPGVLPKLAQGTKDFIAVALNREVEREFGTLTRMLHTIALYPRNAANVSPHIILQPLNHETFRASLAEVGHGSDDISRLENESGRSLTVLRRRLATVPAIRTPQWAADHDTATRLVPFMLIGAWNSANSADQIALTKVAKGISYDDLERECQHLTALNDPPTWSVGRYRGVVSKIDLLFAIANAVTKPDLDRYYEVALEVLGEDDPKLDLPEKERWTAAIHGKTRRFSSAVRESLSETLVLLAVHGQKLFGDRLGIDTQLEATRVVRKLLSPLKTRLLEASAGDLAAYAEAAPNELLSILEDDLTSSESAACGLMKPIASDPFSGGCPRSGLLWALERLAWNPNTLHRAAVLLARLAEIKITDNWTNTPINSLLSIFRSWMPQTAANHETRLATMKLLAERFPKIAWRICLDQFSSGSRIGHYNHKPKWRNDGHGFGEPITKRKVWDFVSEMIDMALTWSGGHTPEMLCDLIERIHVLDATHQQSVWALVMAWTNTEPSDADKALVREKVRVSVLSRRGQRRLANSNTGDSKLWNAAKTVYSALEPVDLLSRHEWLFREHWVQESADELWDDNLDHDKREERIHNLRLQALREILGARNYSGVLDFAEMGNAAGQIGWILATELLSPEDVERLLLAAIKPTPDALSKNRTNLLAGLLSPLHRTGQLLTVLHRIRSELDETEFVGILLLAPFRRDVWEIADTLDERHQQNYWSGAQPDWIRDTDADNQEAIERLLAARRPRAAFACIRLKLETIPPELLFRLLSEIIKGGQEQPGHYQLEEYYIDKAFALIDKAPSLTMEQKALLEFAYLEVLSRPWDKQGHGVPNLERYVEAHPELFIQAVVWTYKRKDGKEDPPEWKVPEDRVEGMALRGYKLVEALERMPGHDDFGKLGTAKLAAWVTTVRDACAELGRLEVADLSLGKLLSRAPLGHDEVWPCEPVRQVMEDVHSRRMMEGAHTGLYNSRGAVWRGEGGNQERELADKYRGWANALRYSHPFLAAELLMGMVNTYEHEASREDTEAGVRRRLR